MIGQPVDLDEAEEMSLGLSSDSENEGEEKISELEEVKNPEL